MNYFLKKRLIAVILVNNNFVVQTKKFKITNPVGDAFSAIDFFNSWTVDEIILLDITRKKTDSKNFYKLVDEVSQRCFVPMAVGGGIKDYNMAKELFNLGADKVVINTEALINSSIITKLMKNFGSQSCLISIDVRNNNFMRSGYEVVINNGNQPTNIDLISWLQKLNELQPGEIMINHLDHDGNKQGYDIQLLKITKRNTHLPVIAMGGGG